MSSLSANRQFGGAFWKLKSVPGIAEEGRFTVDLDREHTRLYNFGGSDLHTDFTPSRVEIRRADESVVDALDDPRASFAGHELTTPWNRLQLAYFTGYAMWTYNTEPRSFLFPGVVTEDIGPWTEPDGSAWDRLRVTYPSSVATHTPVQTVYADADDTFYVQPRVQIAAGAADGCGPWQSFDIRVNITPDSTLFGPTSP